MTKPFVILVEFAIEPGLMDQFLPLMLENAKASLAEEPGCRQFDVLRSATDPDGVTLYEIYDDKAAFGAHLASPHFLAFDKAVASMTRSKRVVELHFAQAGAKPA